MLGWQLWSHKFSALIDWADQVVKESALIRNLTKEQNTEMGPLQSDRAYSRDPESAQFEIL